MLNSRVRLVECGSSLRGAVRLNAGRREHLSLAYVARDIGTIAPLGAEADRRCERTIAWWRNWSKTCQFDGLEKEVVLRSAITLKLLTFCLSGAVVAAATTSIPETIDGQRSVDYRYCWLRDAGLTMSAFLGLGFHHKDSMYLGWLLHATRLSRPDLSILYDVYGRTNLRQRTLTWLTGYYNSSPVRTGNDAIEQVQLDVYG
ncbi:glycoside hydrolase family 15 protein [Bradyrhizobium sp. USDA 10063]